MYLRYIATTCTFVRTYVELLLSNISASMSASNEFVVRKVESFEELKYLSELLKNEDWSLGRNELRCVFSADPSGFFVGELSGKKISTISIIKHGHFAFCSFLVVEKSYRSKGYGLKTWQAASALASVSKGCNIGLNAVENMIGVYEKYGFKRAWIDREFVISASNTAKVLTGSTQLPPVATIKPITEVKFDALVAYDTTVFGASRRTFLEVLTSRPESIGFAAVDDKGGLLGYSMSERMLDEDKGMRIAPLFADNEQIARGLLLAVAEALTSQNPPHVDVDITLVVPDINPVAVNLVESILSGKSDFQPVRMFTEGVPASMNLAKTFAIASLDLG